MSAAEVIPHNPAGLAWCPTCEEEAIPLRRGTCGFCDGDLWPLKAPQTLRQRAKLAAAALDAMDAGEPQAVVPLKSGPVEVVGRGALAVETDGGSAGVAASTATAPAEVDRASNRPVRAAGVEVLALLEGGPLRLVDIATARGTTIASAYSTVAGLVRRGLVRKVSRGVYTLTEPPGVEAAAEPSSRAPAAEAEAEARPVSLSALFSPRVRTAAVELLRALADTLEGTA